MMGCVCVLAGQVADYRVATSCFFIFGRRLGGFSGLLLGLVVDYCVVAAVV